MYQRLIAIACCLASLLLCAPFAAAQNQTQLNGTIRTGPVYPVGRWVPLSIDLANRTDKEITGRVTLPIEGGGASYVLERNVRVPPNARVNVELLATFRPPETNEKPGETPTIGTLRWLGSGGNELQREPLLGIADSVGLGERREATGQSGVLLWQISDQFGEDDIYDMTGLADLLSKAMPYTFTGSNVDTYLAPRRTMAYDAARMVVLDAASLTALDPAQRDALLQHVRGGATLIVARPTMQLGATWIGPYLPADVINEREILALKTNEFGSMKLRGATTLSDAIARPGSVVTATNERGAVASYRQLGFGRVALVGVPINSIIETEEKAAEFWKAVIGPERRSFNDPAALAPPEAVVETPTFVAGGGTTPPAAKTDNSIAGLLPRIVGAKAPPWKTAASIAGLYTGLVAVVLIVSGAKRRPAAFVACVGLGIVLAGGVLLLGKVRGSDQALMMARIATVDLENGVGRQEETLTFFGEKNDSLTLNAGNAAVAQPLVALGTQQPRISMFPVTVHNISSSDGKLNAVWTVRSFLASAPKLEATLSFGPGGANLNVDSGLSSPIEAPRLIWGPSVIPVPNIAPGAHSLSVGPRNPVGSWESGGGMIADEVSKLRNDLLIRSANRPISAAMNNGIRQRPARQLAGFVEGAATAGATAVEPMQRREQTLLRTSLSVTPAAVGSEVRIDPGFVRIEETGLPALPYDATTGIWQATTQGSNWLIGFGPPDGVGKLNPKKIAISMDLRGVGYEINLRRGQCKNGKVVGNPAGEAILTWKDRTGSDDATIEVGPDDVDANGWVWLMFDVNALRAEPGMLSGIGADIGPKQWQLNRWDTTLTGIIAGPPQPVVQTWPTIVPGDEAHKPAPKKPADPKKPDPKKPEPKKPEATKPEPKKQ